LRTKKFEGLEDQVLKGAVLTSYVSNVVTKMKLTPKHANYTSLEGTDFTYNLWNSVKVGVDLEALGLKDNYLDGAVYLAIYSKALIATSNNPASAKALVNKDSIAAVLETAKTGVIEKMSPDVKTKLDECDADKTQ